MIEKLKKVGEYFGGRAKRLTAAVVLVSAAAAAIAGSFGNDAHAGSYKKVVVKNPYCATVLTTIDQASTLSHMAQSHLRLAEKNKGFLREKFLNMAAGEQIRARQYLDRLLDNGKYNAVEVYVNDKGGCEIVKWKQDKNGMREADVQDYGPEGKIIFSEKLTLENGQVKTTTSLAHGYGIETADNSIRGGTLGKTTTLEGKYKQYKAEKEAQKKKGYILKGESKVDISIF
jgi:hypothetical protein